MPVLVGLPLTLPQVAYLDLRRPGWDATPSSLRWYARRIGKGANAAMVAMTGVLLFEVLIALGLGHVAWPATLVAMLGSPLFARAGARRAEVRRGRGEPRPDLINQLRDRAQEARQDLMR